jgi:hypothetical protein
MSVRDVQQGPPQELPQGEEAPRVMTHTPKVNIKDSLLTLSYKELMNLKNFIGSIEEDKKLEAIKDALELMGSNKAVVNFNNKRYTIENGEVICLSTRGSKKSSTSTKKPAETSMDLRKYT